METTERVFVDCGTHRLEGTLIRGRGGEGAVLCHPHPLYGGSMDNNVILALEETYRLRGWTTLRFNFRGVGESTGTYGDGDGEAEDLLYAVRFVEHQGADRIHVAGYSFGAWVALKACRMGSSPRSLALVSPPLNFLDFSGLSLPQCPTWILVGDRDAFADAGRVRSWVEAQRVVERPIQLDLCSGADHFYWGREQEIRRCLGTFLDSLKEFGPEKNS